VNADDLVDLQHCLSTGGGFLLRLPSLEINGQLFHACTPVPDWCKTTGTRQLLNKRYCCKCNKQYKDYHNRYLCDGFLLATYCRCFQLKQQNRQMSEKL
jgi:hypothetical protein